MKALESLKKGKKEDEKKQEVEEGEKEVYD